MKKVVVLFCTVLGLMFTARANIVLSDSFTYPDGDITTAPGSPWVVHSGSTAASVAVGQLRIASGNSADVNALLSGGPYTTGGAMVLYSSFKVKPTALPTALVTYYAHFKDTNTEGPSGFGARIWSSVSKSIDMGLLPASSLRVGTTFGDVAGPNNPPVISGIPNQSTGAGVPTGSIPFVIGDVETAAGSLTLSATSTNVSLVPPANIAFGGSGSNRTVTITPV